MHDLRDSPNILLGRPDTPGEEDCGVVNGDDLGGVGAPTAEHEKACTHEEGLLQPRPWDLAGLGVAPTNVNRVDARQKAKQCVELACPAVRASCCRRHRFGGAGFGFGEVVTPSPPNWKPVWGLGSSLSLPTHPPTTTSSPQLENIKMKKKTTKKQKKRKMKRNRNNKKMHTKRKMKK